MGTVPFKCSVNLGLKSHWAQGFRLRCRSERSVRRVRQELLSTTDGLTVMAVVSFLRQPNAGRDWFS